MPPAELLLPAPAFRTVPEFGFTSGPEVIELCASIDFTPDALQADALNAIHAEDVDGTPAAFEVGLIGPRRNFKTAVMQMACLGWVYVDNVGRVIYTAHEYYPACDEMFEGLRRLINRAGWMRRRVKKFHQGKGEQAIEFWSGQEIMFKTRTADTMRAIDCDKLLLDEGLKVQAAHLGSAVPTLATRPGGQIVWGSSAGKSNSEPLRAVRDRGRAGGDPSLAYFEFCAPDPVIACDRGAKCDHGRRTPGCGCDKPELWRLANPAFGTRITEKYMRNERRTLSPAEFGRERMGWWDAPLTVAEKPPIDPDRWIEIEDAYERDAAGEYVDTPPPASFEFFGVEVDPDQQVASIGTAARRDDGRMHLEHVEDLAADAASVTPRCVELDAEHGPITFVIDGGGPAKPLVAPLQDAGLTVEVLDAADVVAAAAAAMAGINRSGSLKYVHGPDGRLESAVLSARRRNVGERGTTIGRRQSAGIVTPIQAVIWAAYAAEQNEYDVRDSGY